jgi:hypothetical protein
LCPFDLSSIVGTKMPVGSRELGPNLSPYLWHNLEHFGIFGIVGIISIYCPSNFNSPTGDQRNNFYIPSVPFAPVPWIASKEKMEGLFKDGGVMANHSNGIFIPIFSTANSTGGGVHSP